MTNDLVKQKYKEYLNTLDGAATYNRFKEILYGEPDSLVIRIVDTLAKRLPRRTIKILDVGGGDGKRLRKILSLLEARGIHASATLVEPSEVFVQTLRQSLSKEGKNTYHIEVVQSLFETYSTYQKYDVLLFVHSIYTFKDAQYVKNIQKFLKDDGFALFVTNDSDSFLGELKKVLDTTYHSKRKNVESLKDDLSEYGFTIKSQRSSTQFNDCIINDNLNDDGKLIVAWLALSDFDTIPLKMQRAAIDIFKQHSRDGKTTDDEVFITATPSKHVN